MVSSIIFDCLHTLYRAIGLMSRVFASGPGDRCSIPGHTKDSKNCTGCRLAYHSALSGKDQGKSGAIQGKE